MDALESNITEEIVVFDILQGMTQAHLEATKRAKTKYFWFLLLCISVICCRTATTTTKRSILRDYTNLMLKESSIRLYMKSDLSNQNPILHRTFNKILCLDFRKASHLFIFYKLILLSDEMLNETKSY